MPDTRHQPTCLGWKNKVRSTQLWNIKRTEGTRSQRHTIGRNFIWYVKQHKFKWYQPEQRSMWSQLIACCSLVSSCLSPFYDVQHAFQKAFMHNYHFIYLTGGFMYAGNWSEATAEMKGEEKGRPARALKNYWCVLQTNLARQKNKDKVAGTLAHGISESTRWIQKMLALQIRGLSTSKKHIEWQNLLKPKRIGQDIFHYNIFGWVPRMFKFKTYVTVLSHTIPANLDVFQIKN